MTDYYVSAAGSDSNDGSHNSPWKTITRANSALAGMGLGNRVLLRRGDTFYGRLRPPTALDPASTGWLRVGAYGSGARPSVSGYKNLNISSGWSAYDADTWQLDYSAGNSGITYTGYDSAQGGGDVGLLKVDGVIKGMKRKTLGELVDQWDFYSTETVLYVRSTTNPTSLAADIKCSVDGNGAIIKYATQISDLEFVGHGGHGVRANGGSNRNRLLRNLIREIGGSSLDGFGDGTVRYGNGVEVSINSGAANFYGEYNIVHDCFDTAWTIQLGTVGQPYAATNITWRRNLTYRNAQAEEYFYDGNGDGFVNCVSEYNTNLFCGYGFGADTRPTAPFLVAVYTTNWGDTGGPLDLTLRRNIYFDSKLAFSYHGSPTAGLKSDRNVVWLRPGTKMQYQSSQTVENAAAWVASVGREGKSRIGIIPGGSTDDAAVTEAIGALDSLAPVAQKFGGRVLPIHWPWRT